MTAWLVGTGLGAALAVSTAVTLRRTRLGRRLRRMAGATRLTSRAAARWVAHRARAVGRDDAERERLRLAFHLRTAEDVTATMGAMKGAMMKLAQMMSYVDAGLPDQYREALARLQEAAPPMAFELAARVVEEELGRPPRSSSRASTSSRSPLLRSGRSTAPKPATDGRWW